MKKVKLGIFVLGYNVAPKIYGVLRDLPKDVYDAVDSLLIIDNCSADKTVEEAQRAVRDLSLTKATVIRNEKNLGYGGSQKVAFDKLSNMGMDYAILLHGDGQGDLDAIRKIITLCQEDKYDLVIGSRFLDPSKMDKKYSLTRKVGNYFFVFLQKVVSGMPITDPGSGELAYNLKFIKQIPYHRLTSGFHFTPQLVLYASMLPLRYVEFPIHWGEAEISSVNIWKHGWEMLKMLVRFRFRGVDLLPASAS